MSLYQSAGFFSKPGVVHYMFFGFFFFVFAFVMAYAWLIHV
jgi:hypothetical protein